MTPQAVRHAIQLTYDTEATLYANYQNDSFAWQYIEKSGFDLHVKPIYSPQTRVLDIGCGTGAVVRHLVDSGIAPENIVGIDISKSQLAYARQLTPDATFINVSADELEFAAGSFELAISNMAFHHFDNKQLSKALQLIHDALVDDGILFFIDTHPEYDESLKQPNAQNRWLKISTPWGSEQFLFNRSLGTLAGLAHDAGFDILTQTTLSITEEGKNADPANYQKYSSRPSRIAVKLHKRK